MLDRIGDRDFFLWLHYMEPHDPYFEEGGPSYARVSMRHPPAELAEPMHAAYRDDVRRFDTALGELVQALDERGLSDRATLVDVCTIQHYSAWPTSRQRTLMIV